jgi:hypothetical protein
MIYLIENGKVKMWTNKPEIDLTWTEVDISRAKAFEIRFARLGLKEDERKIFIEVIVMKKKHSGLVYSDEIEKRLKDLLIDC